MSYVPAARKDDNVAYSAKSDGEALGHATGLLISELIIPQSPKELYKLLPFLKLAKFPVYAVRLAESANMLKAMKGKVLVYSYKALSSARTKVAEKLIDEGNTLTQSALSQLGGMAGALVMLSGAPIKEGSDNVFINIREAARRSDPVDGYQPIAEGSDIVSINKRPAARYGDRTQDNGTIVEGSLNVFMGGKPVANVEIRERSMGILSDVLDALAKGVKSAVTDGRIKKAMTYIKRTLSVAADALKKKEESRAEDAVKDVFTK